MRLGRPFPTISWTGGGSACRLGDRRWGVHPTGRVTGGLTRRASRAGLSRGDDASRDRRPHGPPRAARGRGRSPPVRRRRAARRLPIAHRGDARRGNLPRARPRGRWGHSGSGSPRRLGDIPLRPGLDGGPLGLHAGSHDPPAPRFPGPGAERHIGLRASDEAVPAPSAPARLALRPAGRMRRLAAGSEEAKAAMRLPRPRLGTLLIAVAVARTASGGWTRRRRREYYLARAMSQASLSSRGRSVADQLGRWAEKLRETVGRLGARRGQDTDRHRPCTLPCRAVPGPCPLIPQGPGDRAAEGRNLVRRRVEGTTSESLRSDACWRPDPTRIRRSTRRLGGDPEFGDL